MAQQIISNARIATPKSVVEGSLIIEDGRIAEIVAGCQFSEGLDARGQWLTPGVIDTHTDYFEKEIHPRPSAEFPLELAFHMMDLRAVSCGLTTVLGAVRVSGDSEDEGEETKKSMWRRDGIHLGHEYERIAPSLMARHRMHVRWDTNFEPVSDKLAALAGFKTLGNVVFNESIPGQRQFRSLDEVAGKWAIRKNVTKDEAMAMIEQQIEEAKKLNNRAEVQDVLAGKIQLGSHDDTTVEHVIEAQEMGCTLAEMPTTLAAAEKAKELGMWVTMGAPNYYRGGSHCGNLSAVEALEKNLVDILCSDYHFPSLLGAVCKMISAGIDPVRAVRLVTLHPAQSLGWDKEIGSIEKGKAADLILFEDKNSFARVSHTWVASRLCLACPATGEDTAHVATTGAEASRL